MFSLLLSSPPLPSNAFDDYGIGCGDDSSVSISFSSDADWNLTAFGGPDNGKTLRAAVEEGRNMWVGSEIEHWSGGAALGGGSPSTKMEISGWITSSALTDCDTDTIHFDADDVPLFRNGSLVLSGLAAHEWGHVWGLGHAGRYDSHGGGAPTMSTCWGNFTEQRGISQDDSAGIQYQTNKSGSFGAATANPSFEEGLKWWGFQDVSLKTIFPSGGQDGSPSYLRFAGPSSSTAIFSTSRLTDFFDGDQIGADIKGRANYKRAANASGHVLVVAKWRHIDYQGSAKDWTCQLDPSTLNQAASIGSFEFQVMKICYPSTSWAYCTTPDGNVVSNDSAGATPEGVDVRIVVYNRMTVMSGTEYTSVDVDRTRALVIRS